MATTRIDYWCDRAIAAEKERDELRSHLIDLWKVSRQAAFVLQKMSENMTLDEETQAELCGMADLIYIVAKKHRKEE